MTATTTAKPATRATNTLDALVEKRQERAAAAWALRDEVVLVGAGSAIGVPGGADLTYPFMAHTEYVWLVVVARLHQPRHRDLERARLAPRPAAADLEQCALDRVRRVAGRDQRLDRDPRVLVLGEKGIEDRVADLVADLVRVSLGDGLGREQELSGHAGAKTSDYLIPRNPVSS